MCVYETQSPLFDDASVIVFSLYTKVAQYHIPADPVIECRLNCHICSNTPINERYRTSICKTRPPEKLF